MFLVDYPTRFTSSTDLSNDRTFLLICDILVDKKLFVFSAYMTSLPVLQVEHFFISSIEIPIDRTFLLVFCVILSNKLFFVFFYR